MREIPFAFLVFGFLKLLPLQQRSIKITSNMKQTAASTHIEYFIIVQRSTVKEEK